jgi:hypothetical protein
MSREAHDVAGGGSNGKHPPYCRLDVAAVRAIHDHFPVARREGKENVTRSRKAALAIYAALTYWANEERRYRDFEASREQVAELAGVSLRELYRIVPELERIGVVKRHRSKAGGLHQTTRWTLPRGSGATPPPRGATPPGVEAPRHAYSKKPPTEATEEGDAGDLARQNGSGPSHGDSYEHARRRRAAALRAMFDGAAEGETA